MPNQSRAHTFIVDAANTGERVDRYLAGQLDHVSRAQVQRAVDAGAVSVDGVVVKSSHKVQAGESIEITLIRPESNTAPPAAEDIPLDVVYEDDALIVINKPAGMVVHPAVGNRTGTLVNALLGRGTFSTQSLATERPGIVHRLDKGTSGLIVCAKTEVAHRKLAEQLRERTLHRTYLAVAWGHLKQDTTTIDEPIGRSNTDRKKMAVNERGREATTHVRVRERYDLAEFLEITLETGRTHQIRVHLNHIGHPIVGDSDYGGGLARLKGIDPAKRLTGKQMVKAIGRPALHAARLELIHPTTGQRQQFLAPAPSDLVSLLSLCRELS